ncbi:PiT family inorganic phosphate transporter [Neorhizobium galegae]|uniref:inorganic phosphate transporter n=1 Tax=Neorhizobium galegae TaxID=399 RepID=UPI003D7C2254|nr:PiT family inorganic phosphate transporter [Neorhizobium galegae]
MNTGSDIGSDRPQKARTPKARTATLDKDLDKISSVEDASKHLGRRLAGSGAGFLFLLAVMIFTLASTAGHPDTLVAIAAAVLAGYMAMNIGANDVANNIGAAVGSKALSLGLGLALAAVCEVAGALIAGNKVAGTIANGILYADRVANPDLFVWAMMAALLAAAIWINIATWISAPVSTTHAIVGGVMGAGIAAAGVSAVNWTVLAGIATSWVVSPLLGAAVAVAMLAFIKTFIIYTPDKIAAARRWVPVLIGVMAGSFAAYLMLMLPIEILSVALPQALLVGLAFGATVTLMSRPLVRRQSEGLDNRNQSLRKLFQLPLIFSAALLSFAHGANDVANAIGPLAAIIGTLNDGPLVADAPLPLWELLIGGLGISMGLLLFGPKLILLVGKEITKLNPMRAYCVALSSAVTVILASSIGAPVSSTHIAVGAVFGVGLFREWHHRHSNQRKAYLAQIAPGGGEGLEKPVGEVNTAELRRRYLVRRSHLLTIVGAWTITVPVSGALAALIAMLMFRLFV